ncbi:MAG: helix-turn-helix transcriptional regulator [bacterium]
MKELTSSFGNKIAEKNAQLTPREIEICNMKKNGFTNKEISRLLCLSIQTVEKHRAKVRNKLGISHTNVNLTSFLQTL